MTRARTEVFFHPDLFHLSTCVSRLLWKITWYLYFWSDKLISNFNVFNNVKISLHYSVYMHASGEKVRVSDEAERVQSVSYSHIRSLSGPYAVVCLKEGKRGTCIRPSFSTVMCKVPCSQRNPTATVMHKWSTLLSKVPQQQLQCVKTWLSKGPEVTVMHKHFSSKGHPNFTDL